jgi:hypothetical protein
MKKGSDGIRVAGGHPMSYKIVLLQDPGGPESTALDIRTGFEANAGGWFYGWHATALSVRKK